MLAGRTYPNAYMLFVDASGHSSVVRNNPQDVASEAFNLVEQRLKERVAAVSQRKRCRMSEPWTWQGDGGLFVFYDEDESIALTATLDSALAILKLDLPHLQQEFQGQAINGELHLRLAINKGTVSYEGDDSRGSIHSAELNFAAHLEEATPSDHLAIPEAIMQLTGQYKAMFTHVGTFENRKIYLHSPMRNPRSIQRAWLTGHGMGEFAAQVLALYERPSAFDKGRIISSGEHEVIDLGTALNTCSNYLVTTERPTHFRDAVLDLLSRGGAYRCYMLDVNSPEIPRIANQFGEDSIDLATRSIQRFELFKRRHASVTEQFEVYTMTEYPGFAAMGVDISQPNGLLLLSPYLRPLRAKVGEVSRADFAHYLFGNLDDPLSQSTVSLVESYRSPENVKRIV